MSQGTIITIAMALGEGEMIVVQNPIGKHLSNASSFSLRDFIYLLRDFIL